MEKNSTIMTKEDRLDIIKARHMAKGYATYWLTRNSIQGLLSKSVDVWLVRPYRALHDGDVMWIPGTTADKSYYGRWTLDEAYSQVRGGTPEDDRQCLKVG